LKESCVIAKMAARCALYMDAVKIFVTPWLRPRLLIQKNVHGLLFWSTYECLLSISAVFCGEACGGVYVEQSGNITSPYFPDPYPHNKECVYVIRQPEGSTITLTFQRFNLEGSSSNRCVHDYLEVFDIRPHIHLMYNKVYMHVIQRTTLLFWSSIAVVNAQILHNNCPKNIFPEF